ncbi:MAG: type II secretion system F family protein [Candidatus Micrarchaeota archaeon]
MPKRYFEMLTQVAPKQMASLKKMLIYADISLSPPAFLLTALFESLVLGAIASNVLPGWFGLDSASSFVIGLVGGIITAWGALVVMADRKTKDIEENLPDTLLLIASNVRAGETIDWAMTSALRHAYGPIRAEFDKTARELASGLSIEESFNNLAERNQSSILRNVVDLMLFGMQSGGNMSDLLTDISFEIRMTQTLQKEVEAQVAVYRAFFIMIILFIAPILLAISTNFLLVTKSFGERLSGDLGSVAAASSSPMGMQSGLVGQLLVKIQQGQIGGQISVQDMYIFSYSLCVLSSVVASVLLGVISRGEAKAGLRYIPVFVIVSVLIYYYSNQVVFGIMNEMFGGLLTGG